MSFCLVNEELGVEYVINFFAVKTYNGSKDKNAKAEILSGNKSVWKISCRWVCMDEHYWFYLKILSKVMVKLVILDTCFSSSGNNCE